MPINYYQVVDESRTELRQKVAEREELDKRITELRTVLRALVKFIPEAERQQVMEEVKNAKRKGLSLTEAVTDLLAQSQYKTGLTGNQIRERLEESGFDLGDYSQPLAALQTTLQRLAEQKKINRRLSKDGIIYSISPITLLKKANGGD